jgi:hypothetical protein
LKKAAPLVATSRVSPLSQAPPPHHPSP